MAGNGLDKATERILELAKEGLNYAEIAKKLEDEGITNSKGVAFNAKAVYSRRLRAESKQGKHNRPPDTSEHADKSAISDVVRKEIRAIVQEEIKAAMECQTPPQDQTALAPKLSSAQKIIDPETKHKKGPEKRPKIAGTVDPELMRRFDEWRIERSIGLSQALDTVLWHFFNKPKLSFEASEGSDE